MIIGDIPYGNVILAAADPIYLLNYGPAFVNSGCYNGNRIHLHIFNHEDNKGAVIETLKKFKQRWGDLFSASLHNGSITSLAAMASVRFHVAPFFIDYAHSLDKPINLLILDIDSVIRKIISFPQAAVGLFWRKPFGDNEWERRGTRVAAGAVFYDSTSLLFAKRVSERITELGNKWFVDQVALAEIADEFWMSLAIYDFGKDPLFLDWNFHDDGIIWTGKGNRKYTDKRYLSEVTKWEEI